MTFEKVLNQLKSGVAVSRKKWIYSPKHANYIYKDSKGITWVVFKDKEVEMDIILLEDIYADDWVVVGCEEKIGR